MKKLILTTFLSLSLISCFKSNQNREFNFSRQTKQSVLPDIVAHGLNPVGFNRTNYLHSSKEIVKHVRNGDIQIVNEGKKITLIIPTDLYFIFDTPKLNDLKHKTLTDIVKLVKCFPNSTIYVAGFTDDIGTYKHRRDLSKQRAQSIVAYLWAHGVNERKIESEGYGSKYAHSNNHLIHGSALNRRVEIQWTV